MSAGLVTLIFGSHAGHLNRLTVSDLPSYTVETIPLYLIGALPLLYGAPVTTILYETFEFHVQGWYLV